MRIKLDHGGELEDTSFSSVWVEGVSGEGVETGGEGATLFLLMLLLRVVFD
jgi:hypothetical protein